ncbi:DUF4249 domain-containing protein [Wocania ichthyoenteri]|uniref:DUF4249 domain-containing protein n=1 Tax=Wocania ichthyoenteri TaxID=1230531 RepID=UPI00053EE09A|nr:DUF4249 domain-containing protein [Wocania ichthyoenteri]
MKIYIKSFLILLCIGITSCEDVIDVEVPTSKPRLVIEASLDWQKGTSGNNQIIKLSTSKPYFENTINNSVSGALVKVTNNNSNAEYVFVDQNDGTYTVNNFVPVINNNYTLEVVYNNETYNATETFKSVSPIKRVEQSLEGGFDEDVLDVSIFWDDPVDEENFYLIKFIEQGDLIPIFGDSSDEFVNGNELDALFEAEKDDADDQAEYNPGDVVEFTLYGVSKRYNNYMSMLIEQYDSAGDPFSPVPSKLKGNCINIDSPEDYAFGYFRLSEFDTVTYTFQ